MVSPQIPFDARCYTLENGACLGSGCRHSPLEDQIKAAIADPGSFTARLPGEPVYIWSTRIIMELIKGRVV